MMTIGMEASGERPLSALLEELPPGRAVTLGETLDAMGPRAHGCALLLLALPDAVPLPLPSLSVLLALPLLAVAAHLAAFGGSGGLPRRVSGVALPSGAVAALRHGAAPLLRRAEEVSHPRWQPVPERALALVCLYLAAILLLPLPFFNAPPALCLALLAWGMVQRDGVFVVAGLLGTILMTAALGWVGGRLWVLATLWVPGLG